MVSRVDRSAFSEWLWTIDRYMLVGIFILMVSGLVLSLAASPPVAERIGLESFYFVKKQAAFLIPSIALMLGISALSPRYVRRAALLVFCAMLVLLLGTLFFGADIKGARRWISLFGVSIQPSEFIKPALVVIISFLLSEGRKAQGVPGQLISIILFAVVAAMLVAQPDFGQTMLLTIVLFALFFLNGLSWLAIVPLGLLGILGVGAGFTYLPHVRGRIMRFLDPSSGDTYQIDKAIDSFIAGGWLGRGVGEGTVKRILPDSHTDFVFAVAAEEYGIIVCVLLVSVFAFVVLRGLYMATQDQDPFGRLASSGLIVMFGLQSCINMAVNLNLIPAKGMTLPLISSGVSSLMAISLTMGFVLALTRKRPHPRKNPIISVPRAAPAQHA
ncbi:putative peptidoglycan glycosyltransferase FtsW [Pseudovibrio sp. Tun.PSC04-5.I4]|uniref:FtsW/RodA/SpoVE family cell cycle protein n=1 Tax=Pseudovibrio sp. Tun.PSC04-5.I4 TaxID=1798213 RepID=UPI00088DFD0E|nr:putative peptidoglycan glycosyltransferase FtsW [Pseudovibrio sp. Tun.PSC04-5.I4]SDR35774.1 cell division protein FtsW [Pseudovibrio sp. Tun.PSC04-5.I4]